MAVTHTLPPSAQVSRTQQWARLAYLLSACCFAACVALQVFFAGAGVLVNPDYWRIHQAFGQSIQWLTFVLLGLGLLGRLPRTMQWLNVALIVLFVLQYLFLLVLPRLGIPAVRGLHAANALALFWVAVYLGQSSWRLLRLSRHASPTP